MDGRGEAENESSFMVRADESPILCLGILLQHKEGLEQGYSDPNTEEVAKNDKRVQKVERVHSKVS